MSSGCFYCRNHRNAESPNRGFLCCHGLDTEVVDNSPEGVIVCEKGDVQSGFQIGGYYRHMWFEGTPPTFFRGGVRAGGCLEWHIEGNDEFPHCGHTKFHLCEWQQLEVWVEFWGKELRRRGWVVDEKEDQE